MGGTGGGATARKHAPTNGPPPTTNHKSMVYSKVGGASDRLHFQPGGAARSPGDGALLADGRQITAARGPGDVVLLAGGGPNVPLAAARAPRLDQAMVRKTGACSTSRTGLREAAVVAMLRRPRARMARPLRRCKGLGRVGATYYAETKMRDCLSSRTEFATALQVRQPDRILKANFLT